MSGVMRVSRSAPGKGVSWSGGREPLLGPSASLRRLDLAVLRGAFVTSESSRRWVASVTSETARSKASALACEGLLAPLIFRTYCCLLYTSDAADDLLCVDL